MVIKSSNNLAIKLKLDDLLFMIMIFVLLSNTFSQSTGYTLIYKFD